LKASSASSAPTTAPAQRAPRSAAARNSVSPPSPIVDGFALSGVSTLPDPATNAFRKDLADTALAGRVIASHYAEPLLRRITTSATAFAEPSQDSDVVAQVEPGDELRMLDCSRGWAWGYLADGRVAYLTADAVSA
jgi:hypothetical protein